MTKIVTNLLLALVLSTTVCYSQQEQDTASVTWSPQLGVYLLEYNLAGITYVDTLEPATKIDPVVGCAVTFDSSTNLYTLSYVLSLLPSSQQYLLSFRLYYSASIEQRQKPTARWDIFTGTNNTEWANTNIDTTGLHTDTTDIGPGGSLSGFSYKSYGLPSIVDGYLRGNPPGLAFTEEPPVLMEILLAPILHFPNNTVVRRTLGPKDPPTAFTALTFLDTIKSYITESRTLGWITTQGTADKYTALINSAQANLASTPPQRGVAKAKLDSVLVNVYPDSSSALITSEAYALLRFNTEYVLKKLREEDEQGKVIEGKEK
jgi:hypothetical protein